MKTRVSIPPWAPAAALGLVASLVLAVVCGWNRTVSASADMTYHLQVLDAVRHGGPIPRSAEAYMDIMYTYANLGHRVAAATTWLGMHDLNALIMVSTFSAALIWFCLFDQARRVGAPVLIAGAALSIGNVILTRASFGAEIVYQFFYSQMAGEGFAVAALVMGQPILARARRAYAAYAVLCTILAGCIHLIPALHVAGGAMALLGIEALRDFLRERKIDWALVLAILVMPVALVANPFFWGMRLVSSNDGAVTYNMVFSFTQLTLVELMLLSLSAWVLLAKGLKRDPLDPGDRAAALLAALGAAVAVAALAQVVAYVGFHESSPYAVRKEAFGVFSMLCFAVPLYVAEILKLRRPARPAMLAVVVLAQAAMMTLLFNRPNALDVPAVDRLLADARALRQARGLEKTDILLASSRERPVVNYIVGSAGLRRPRDEVSLEVLLTGYPIHMDRVARIATGVGTVFDRIECREGPPFRGLVVVKASCVSLPAFVFRAGGNGLPYLREGWEGAEQGGVWSNGHRAVVEIPVPEDVRRFPNPWVEVAGFAYLPDRSPSRTVRVSIEGGASAGFTFILAGGRSHAFVLPLTPEQARARSLRLVFDIQDPVSPASAGEGDDPRLLGFGLDQIRILPEMSGR
jgi:hypothetical protein